MKICMIYYSYFQTLLKRDANAHLERGDEVEVFCYALPGERKTVVQGGLRVHRLFERRTDEKSPVDYLLKMSRFWLLTFFKVAIQHLKKKYDLVHIVSPPDFMVAAAILPKLLGAKVILNIHDISPEFYMRKFGVQENHIMVKILEFIEKICCRFSDHVLVVTDIWKDKLIKRTGIPKSKCTVFMNVFDDRILAKRRETKQHSDFRLLYPGNLGEHFGVETLIRAMPLVKQEVPLIRLDIYGNGHQREHLQDLVRILGVENIINFGGYIPIEELALVMQETDVGIVPTLDGIFAGEALSGKSLEFLAVGTPIVISRTKASQYYYDDSMVKFFEPGNAKDLAAAVIDLYRNPERRERLVQNAKIFGDQHNWEYYKKIYLGVIDKLCSKAIS